MHISVRMHVHVLGVQYNTIDRFTGKPMRDGI